MKIYASKPLKNKNKYKVSAKSYFRTNFALSHFFKEKNHGNSGDLDRFFYFDKSLKVREVLICIIVFIFIIKWFFELLVKLLYFAY